MGNKYCAACGQSFRPRPQVRQQSYCSALDCQRQRRQQWQRLKLQSDSDYQDNQARAQKVVKCEHGQFEMQAATLS